MSNSYHLSQNGKWAPCEARSRACPLGGNHIPAELYAELCGDHPGYDADAAPLHSKQLPQLLAHAPESLPAITVAPEGYAGVACPKCGRYQPRDMRHAENMAVCPACGHYDTLQHFDFALRADEARYLDDAEVRSANWYHVSTNPNWVEAVKDGGRNKELYGIFVHLGSREAAMDRLRDLCDTGRGEVGDFYLHEVRLKQGAEISPNLYLDEDRWPDRCHDVHAEQEFAGYSATGATRYVNTFESPGTVSLIASGDCFESVASVHILLRAAA